MLPAPITVDAEVSRQDVGVILADPGRPCDVQILFSAELAVQVLAKMLSLLVEQAQGVIAELLVGSEVRRTGEESTAPERSPDDEVSGSRTGLETPNAVSP